MGLSYLWVSQSQSYKHTLAFNPFHLDIDKGRFVKCNWDDFYQGAMEPTPEEAP
jgi:hypothetical protein